MRLPPFLCGGCGKDPAFAGTAMTYEQFKNQVTGKRAEVLGIGVSNLPLIDFLLECGMTVRARDKKNEDALGECAKTLKEKGVELILGDGYLEELDGDYIFRSPGIRPDLPQIVKGVKKGAVLTSEMEVFFELCPARTIAVTGSDGKTTTTTLISLLLKEAGHRVYVGGNIGAPLLPHVREMRKGDFAVLELSSFQLMTMKRSAEISVVTNLSPNHLDWHTGMEEYIKAKTNIFTHGENRLLILNADNEASAPLKELAGGEVEYFSSKRRDTALYDQDGVIFEGDRALLSSKNILLPGSHNRQNYMAAYLATRQFISPEHLASVAKSFGGVEHRLEFVREYRGIRCYNSSIDSSPSRTAAALSCFDQKVVVICGGYDKNIPFEPLAQALCKKAKKVVLTGATMMKIAGALFMCEAEEKPAYYMNPDFDAAVQVALTLCEEGDVLLLSPACASFDAFPNFMARGAHFKKLINDLPEEQS